MKPAHGSSTSSPSPPKARRPRWPRITWTSPADQERPRILGLNPWITDFAAFNLWSRPAGLLSCLDTLRRCGATVALLDCCDPTWEDMTWPSPEPDGRGHLPKTPIPKPAGLEGLARIYGRYGLPLDAVAEALARLDPRPDLVLVTTVMTYWYPGAVTAMQLVRDIWPGVPLVLGGIYPSLCPDHARSLGLADLVVTGDIAAPDNWTDVWRLLGGTAPEPPTSGPGSLALDLYPAPDFSVILGSRGCPFDCPYCASKRLAPAFLQRDPDRVWSDVQPELTRGVQDFAFYDDALLVNRRIWLTPLLERIVDQGLAVRLHTPNALHVRELDADICRLMRRAGLATVRLGLETADFDDRLDRKLTLQEWRAGVAHLREAGFQDQDLGAYILFGLPGQDPEELKRTIRFAHSFGVRPVLTQYSPVPGSRLFDQACRVSPFPLAQDPVFHNNSIWPCVPEGFSWKARAAWRKLLRSDASGGGDS